MADHKYSTDEKLARAVIDRVFGGDSLKDSLGKVKREWFFRVVNDSSDLSQLYDRAQQVRAEMLADEVIEIADDSYDAAKAKNRIAARQWYASKMNPKKYGEKLDLNTGLPISLMSAIMDAEKRMARIGLETREPIKDVKSEPGIPQLAAAIQAAQVVEEKENPTEASSSGAIPEIIPSSDAS